MLSQYASCKEVEHSFYDFNRQYGQVLTVDRLATV